MDTYVLEIDPDPKLVPTARMFAATVARQLGATEDSVLDVKIAISEACTNAVQAHQDHGSDAPIRLRIREGEDNSLLYEIADEGEGVEPPAEEPPEIFKRALEHTPEQQGMGLALIRALFPDAEFAADGDGTTVRFRLRR